MGRLVLVWRLGCFLLGLSLLVGACGTGKGTVRRVTRFLEAGDSIGLIRTERREVDVLAVSRWVRFSPPDSAGRQFVAEVMEAGELTVTRDSVGTALQEQLFLQEGDNLSVGAVSSPFQTIFYRLLGIGLLILFIVFLIKRG